MKHLVFALQFTGTAEPIPGASDRLRARTVATGQTLRSSLGPSGVQASIEAADRTTATFESEVQMGADGSFLESGTISYGPAGKISFKTVGRGVLGPSAIDGLQRGAVIWEVTGGDRMLSGATGLITSNFSVDGTGKVVDNQFAQLFVK
jgi:hypothetical protein